MYDVCTVITVAVVMLRDSEPVEKICMMCVPL
jgi:hypothetical protein